MPSKPTSPEAAQRKTWQSEIRSLEKSARKIAGDFAKARTAALRPVIDARKALTAAERKATREIDRLHKREPAALKAVDRRIAILRGRLGQ